MLRISTKIRYAVRILICLGSKGAQGPVQRTDIQKSEGVSMDYAVQILSSLKRSGFVDSIRGKEGGYVLSVPPESITILDVVEAIEGGIMFVPCASENCPRISECVVKPVWDEASAAASSVLSATTIKSLIDETIKRQQYNSPNFVI